MKPDLSKKQKLFLDFVDNFIKNNQFSPSYREIASGLNYKSLATVAEHINNLINLGYLKKSNKGSRSIELTNINQKPLELIDQIKIRYNQLNELEKNKVNQSFKILNIDILNELLNN